MLERIFSNEKLLSKMGEIMFSAMLKCSADRVDDMIKKERMKKIAEEVYDKKEKEAKGLAK